jgi:hypothetical protein
MKSKSGRVSEIRELQEKLGTLCSRVDHLENLSSRYNNKNGELQVVTTEQSSDVGNRQEQQVNSFFDNFFLFKKSAY